MLSTSYRHQQSIAFSTPMTPIGIAGSSIAMAGVLVYSLVQQAVSPDLKNHALLCPMSCCMHV
jgi:hypothetical protein